MNSYQFKDLEPLFTLYDNFQSFNKSSIDFLKNLDDTNYNNYLNIIKNTGERLEFNIFKSLSDKWEKEDFHSDVLEVILTQNQDQVYSLIDYLKQDDRYSKINKENYSDYTIEREKGKIDLNIVGNKHAIIIENKLNDAPDQPSQLYRYYKLVNERNLTVDAIIYLPKRNEKPSKDSLGYIANKSNKSDKNRIKIAETIDTKLLKVIVGFNGQEKNDLVSILKNGIINQKDHSKKLFIENYIDLLKDTGAGDMSMILEKFIEEMKNNPELIEKGKYLVDMLEEWKILRAEEFKRLLNKGKTSDGCWQHEYTIAKMEVRVWDYDKTTIIVYGNENIQDEISKLLTEHKFKTDRDGDYILTLTFPQELDKTEKILIELDEEFVKYEVPL